MTGPSLSTSMEKGSAAPSEKFLPGFGTAVGGTPAYRRYARGAQKCYKPITTRLPFLAGVLILTLALIAIVEIVLRQYPIDSDLGSLAAPSITSRFVSEGSEDGRIGMDGAHQERNIRARVLSVSVEPSLSSSADSSMSGLGSYIQIGVSSPTTLVETLTTDSSAYNPTTIPSFSPNTNPSAYIPTYTTIPGAYIPVATPTLQPSYFTTIRDQTVSSAYIPVTSVIEVPSVSTFLSRESHLPESFYRTSNSAYVPPSTSPPNTAPSGYIPTFTSIPGAYIPTTQPLSVVTTITLPDDPQASITFTTTPGAYIQSETPAGGASSVGDPKNGGGTLPVAQFTNIPTSTINDPNIVATALVPVATHTSGGMAVVVLGSPSKIPMTPVSTYTSNGVALVVMGSSSETPLVALSTYTSNGAAYVVMGTPSKTSLVPISTMTSNGVAVVILGLPTSQPTDPVASRSSYSVVVEQVTSTSGGVAFVYMTTITLGPSQLASGTATAAVSQNTAATTTDQEKTTIAFTNLSYFAAWYLPTMIAVAFRVLWTAVYNNARLMEPFYRLASPAGVTGSDALDNLYLSMGSIVPEPVLALLSGHSYMLLVSTIAYLVELVAPLSSEFLGVDVHHGCIPDPSLPKSNHPCPTRIVVRLVPARVLQGLLCLIAVFIIFTMFLSRHRPSGVYSNPSSIAVMASLLHHPDVLQDFQHLGANNKELEQAIKDQTYRLAHYQSEGEGMKYGIVPTVKVILPETGSNGAYNALPNPEGGVCTKRRHHGLFTRHLFRTVGDIGLAILLLGIFGVTLGYYLDGANDGFNIFFNSDTFGPRFILTFAGGIAVSQWKRLEKEIRTLQPYRNLYSSSSSSPTNTILRTSTSTPYTTLPLAIARFELFAALIAFCYILSEILVIMLVTVPFSSDEYWMAFLAGTYITLSILSLQILAFTAMMTWWRWTAPRLDRDPDTLMGVWTLLAASGIREDFDDMATAGRDDLVRTVLAWDKRYWLGDVVGKDGAVRTGIHSDAAHDDARFERFRGERPPSPLPFPLPTLPTLPEITVSSDI